MKFKLSAVVIIFVGIFLSCNREYYDLPRKKIKGPLETIWVNNNLYFDETEVTNVEWRYYLECIAKKYGKNSQQYHNALPDTTVWLDTLNKNQALVSLYYRDYNYANYPVVGVTYEQAIEYCKWKTDTVIKVYDNIKNKKILPKKITFRLPTKEEWQLAAITDLTYQTEPYGYENIISKENTCKVVCKEYVTLFKSNSSEEPKLCSAYYGQRNRYNLYNMAGNVAEMVAEKNMAMGGSWKDTFNECKVTSEQKYTKPASWLGFRCVCDITVE
ncbi:MAG: SUMF1/EgtB/PvdO family nonheme iron enzyme [Bacteroidales bacterium]|jgi:formylglycine-generating enzyme required for sulfatase activity